MNDDPPATDGGSTDCRRHREVDRVSLTVKIAFTAFRIACPCDFQQLAPQDWSIGGCQAECHGEDSRFVPPSWTIGIQAVLRQLSKIDDRSRSVRQPHEDRLRDRYAWNNRARRPAERLGDEPPAHDLSG